MSGLARYFHHRGYPVAGYDRTPSALTKELEKEGIEIVYGDDQLEIGDWKLKLFHGILNVAVSAGCFIFINNPGVAVLVYGIGLVYSGILRIISAFRKTTFVYIR